MGPMLPRRVAVAALGLLTLAPALAACGSGGDIKIGDVVPAREDAQFSDGAESSVVLPLGRLEVNLGEPTTQLAANDNRQLEPIDAPDGSTFVPITWQYASGTFGDYAAYLDTDAKPVVELVADGATYRLPSPDATGEGSKSFYVLVSGKGADPKLQVDFDGVVQSVDLTTGERDAGRAEALYDLEPRKERNRSCATDAEFGRTTPRLPDFTCTISRTARIPYAGGKWADEGRSWLVLTVTTSLRRWDEIAEDLRSGAIYLAGAVESVIRLGALKPAAVIEDRDNSVCPDTTRGGCTTQYHLVFDVAGKAPTTLKVQQVYDLYLTSVWAGGEGKDILKLPVTVRTSTAG